jgi:hypothetical protein
MVASKNKRKMVFFLIKLSYFYTVFLLYFFYLLL